MKHNVGFGTIFKNGGCAFVGWLTMKPYRRQVFFRCGKKKGPAVWKIELAGCQTYGSDAFDWLVQDFEPLSPRFELDWVPFGAEKVVWFC